MDIKKAIVFLRDLEGSDLAFIELEVFNEEDKLIRKYDVLRMIEEVVELLVKMV